MLVKHTIKPIYNKDSKILILGSMPSIVSRDNNFFYAHKQNRFWKVLAILFKVELNSIIEKRRFLLKNNIGIFDMIKECEIKGSSDSSITKVKINDIESIVNSTKIKYVFCTGKTSFKLYKKYFSHLNVKCFCLPSPSSANATYSLDKLVDEYKIVKDILKDIE